MAASGNKIATPNELGIYRSIIGKILFVGRMTQLLLLRMASLIATKTSKLLVHHSRDLKALLKYAKRYEPCITFNHPANGCKFHLDTYTDASMAGKKENGARGEFIIFRRCGDTVHPIYWSSRKLRRVARSSSTAEILAAADAVDMTRYIQEILAEITYSHAAELTSDSRALYNLMFTTKEPNDSLNKLDLAAMRAAFEDGHLRAVNWTPVCYMLADALTKDNRGTSSLLLKTLRECTYSLHPDAIRRLSPKEG
eukprot:IDg5283t1